MKEKVDLKTAVALWMAIFIFSMPLLAMTQQSEMEEARFAAERAAEANTNGTLWFAVGCLGGILGLLVAYVYAPSPPASDLIGKSPEYVAYYTDYYKAKAKSIQSGKALTGCLVSVAAYVVYIVVVVAAAGSSY
jgi:hypothetical protein